MVHRRMYIIGNTYQVIKITNRIPYIFEITILLNRIVNYRYMYMFVEITFQNYIGVKRCKRCIRNVYDCDDMHILIH